jgi:hypothetical protein
MIGADYEVLTSGSGEEALQLIENSEPVQVVVGNFNADLLPGVIRMRKTSA